MWKLCQHVLAPWLLIVAYTIGAWCTVAAQDDQPAEKSPMPSDQEVQAWVKQLDADQFLVREVATQRLIAAGVQAVEPLVEAIPVRSKEVATRAIYVLQQLALDSNRSSEEAAHLALEHLVAEQGGPASRRAKVALERVASAWAKRALDELKKLGAVVGPRQSTLGLQMPGGYAIEIGEKWTGKTEDLTLLRWLSGVGELIFRGPQVTDRWLEYVPGIRGLRALTIKRAKITDAGVKELAKLEDLDMVSLMYVPITDGSIEHLQQIQRVRMLRIYGTKIRGEGASLLQEKLPGTNVDYRRGAFLGIGCQNTPEGCVIYTVRPDSAALEAGLLTGDVLTKYREKPVVTFEQLTELISQDEASKTVSIEILRGTQRLTKRITLGEWD